LTLSTTKNSRQNHIYVELQSQRWIADPIGAGSSANVLFAALTSFLLRQSPQTGNWTKRSVAAIVGGKS
jgi:hypothetical protein